DRNHQVWKVAVAVALLQTKPEGITTVDYIRQMAEQYRRHEEQLTDRCFQLEMNIFNLRQQLAVIELRNVTKDVPPGNSTWKEQSATTGGDKNHARSGHFRQHWIFLESFLTISSHEASQTTISDTSQLVLESAQKLFSSIYQTHPIEDIEMDLCTKGLSSLAKICDTKHQVHDSLRSAAMDFVKRTIVEICNWRRPLEHDRQNCLARCVEALASSTNLWFQITTLLLNGLVEFDCLITSFTLNQKVDGAEFFDCVFFLLLCLEKTLAKPRKLLSHEEQSLLSNFSKVLADITVKFQATEPLFAFYVRKISVLLDRCIKQQSVKGVKVLNKEEPSD
ncbi:unnamed protein product, partial [Ixodes pacificus]